MFGRENGSGCRKSGQNNDDERLIRPSFVFRFVLALQGFGFGKGGISFVKSKDFFFIKVKNIYILPAKIKNSLQYYEVTIH